MIEDRISQSRLLHFSPHHWMQAGEGALPVHLSTDPLTPSPASEDALSLPAAQGLHQEPPAHSQVLLPSQGWTCFLKSASNLWAQPCMRLGCQGLSLSCRLSEPWILTSYCMAVECHLKPQTSQKISHPHPLHHPGYRNSQIFLFMINWLMLGNHQFKIHFRQSYWNVLCMDISGYLNYKSLQ